FGDEPLDSRSVLARARGVFADDDELGALAFNGSPGDDGRRAHEVLLSFNLAQLADDADAQRPSRRPPLNLSALECRARLLEAAQVNPVRDDANPFGAGDFLRAQRARDRLGDGYHARGPREHEAVEAAQGEEDVSRDDEARP